jgi:chaperonin GroEL
LEAIKKTLHTDDEKTGVDILWKALAEPMKGIVRNAGVDEGWVINTVETHTGKEASYGYNVMMNTFGDMVLAGVIDPAKVTRSAVENAASVGMMVLTTEALVTDIPEKEKAPAMPAGGMGGMW